MTLKRTNVYADAEDLAIIKEAATRKGISEAEIIRKAIHLAALSERTWDEPAVSRKFRGGGRQLTRQDVREAVVEGVLRKGSGAGDQ
ncbi:ribbon-helix-helix domain-containing protein [Streptomyces sp. A3M-1-3]|uniref:ribbon-helix-helix domain-containing protein n=1 Tax=Streptomyces sp. A3M-1-3 TaxID=2962044 RepID=UPI0020B8BF02|nr:CopG family transcriptional regulator [Streptomyces sp. A3M-1-3]MCP3817612.1 ribbon-helix-helix domain-containing protein [Streptomyces sp. A3M-1-3]